MVLYISLPATLSIGELDVGDKSKYKALTQVPLGFIPDPPSLIRQESV